jgi:hypothetical protein
MRNTTLKENRADMLFFLRTFARYSESGRRETITA